MVGLYAIKYFSTRCAPNHCLSDTLIAYYARPPRLTYAPTEFNQDLLEARYFLSVSCTIAAPRSLLYRIVITHSAFLRCKQLAALTAASAEMQHLAEAALPDLLGH